jgi:hypothetical protein
VDHDHARAIPNHSDRDTNRSGCGFSAKIRCRTDLPGGRSVRLAWARFGIMPAGRARRAQQTRERLESIQRNAAQRSECDGLVTTGGAPSYVELLTCLEMAKQAKELPEDSKMGNPIGRR